MTNLSKYLFWDLDPAQLSYKQHAGFIIVRVVRYGVWEDWKYIVNFYGKKQIKKYDLNSSNFFASLLKN